MKFLPERHVIASFGDGGFRFAHLSHQGPLLVLPSGMHAWDGTAVEKLLAEAGDIDFLVWGTGARFKPLNPAVTKMLGAENLWPDAMSTSAAVHSYNLMLGEARRVAAALLPVELPHG